MISGHGKRDPKVPDDDLLPRPVLLLLERWDQAKTLRGRGGQEEPLRAAALERDAVETGERLGVNRLLRDAPNPRRKLGDPPPRP